VSVDLLADRNMKMQLWPSVPSSHVLVFPLANGLSVVVSEPTGAGDEILVEYCGRAMWVAVTPETFIDFMRDTTYDGKWFGNLGSLGGPRVVFEHISKEGLPTARLI
jgi:hypothetical protein